MSKYHQWPVPVFIIGLCLVTVGFAWIHGSLRTVLEAVRIDVQIPVFFSMLLLGTGATFVGGVIWARQASNSAIIMAVVLIAFVLLIIANRVTLGFDDGVVLVMPFGIFLALSLAIARAVASRRPRGTNP